MREAKAKMKTMRKTFEECGIEYQKNNCRPMQKEHAFCFTLQCFRWRIDSLVLFRVSLHWRNPKFKVRRYFINRFDCFTLSSVDLLSI